MKEKLISWYINNKRDLPFRGTKDPYKVWISEIIFQQTRIDQGIVYYERFIAKYPTVWDLSAASEDDVLILWQGLGYYSRARNLLAAAKTITTALHGEFPKNSLELRKLKGVGEYTAAAIASICYNEAIAVIDGNVYRVLSRFFAESAPIDTSKGQKRFKILATKILNTKEPGEHNQALMELGALICTPTNPDCLNCPLHTSCISNSKEEQMLYPVKQKKIKQRDRFIYLYIIRCKSSTIIQKRPTRDIWAGLYQFPLYESSIRLTKEEIISVPFIKELVEGNKIQIVSISSTIKHVLSHQTIYARFIHVNIDNIQFFDDSEYIIIDLEEVKDYAMPRLITRYLEKTDLRE